MKNSSRSLFKVTLLITFCFLIISACANNETSEGSNEEKEISDESAITYKGNVEEIIANNCLSCHGSNDPIPLDTYDNLLDVVTGSDKGALMRRLDNGENTDDGEPGNMYEFLGETVEEREEHLETLKEWVGHWTLKREDELTEDDEKKFKLAEE